MSPRNAVFGPIADSGRLAETDPATAIHDAVAPADGDIVVTKRRISAFAGSDLEVVLRSAQVEYLVLAGLVTSGVVLSTLTDAVDRDFAVTVLSDACADPDGELHVALMDRHFPKRGVVTTTAEWIAGLGVVRG